MLLLDVDLAHAAATDPAAVRARDPALMNGVRPSHIEWLGGPLLRYCNGAVDVQLRYELETSCPVAGSYCLDALATVKLGDGRDKRFSVFRFKRYDADSLIRLLASLGWECLLHSPYGPNQAQPSKMLLLFRRAKDKVDGRSG